jgi:hypothetical protein
VLELELQEYETSSKMMGVPRKFRILDEEEFDEHLPKQRRYGD